MKNFQAGFAVRICMAALFSCGLVGVASAQNAQQFTVANLTADVAGAATNTDPNLINPVGISHGILGPWWVANGGSATSTLYDGNGGPRPLVVNLPPAPGSSTPTSATGTVFNFFSPAFNVSPGNPALFMFVTLDGTILGWNPNVDVFNAIVMVNRHGKASYTGMTTATHGATPYLYAVNALTGRVEVFDGNLHQVSLDEDAFLDHGLGDDLIPFNVQNIGPDIVVTYRSRRTQNGHSHDAQGGVAIFDATGRFLSRLQAGDSLNDPWGVAMAPSDFGAFSHALLIGNHGSGQISAFDPFTGRFIGFVLDPNGNVVSIDGLWALGFGNGGIANFPPPGPNNGPYNACYFTAGTNMGQHGLFGNLIPMVPR